MISTGRDGSICEDMPSCSRCALTVIAGVPVHQDFCPGYLGERQYIVNVTPESLRAGESEARRRERDEDDPYPDRIMVDAQGRPHYEP